MMEYLISIIVPVYNTEQYLENCIDSLIKQTYANIEIVLVDDGSTDKSGKICDQYAGQDFRIRVIHKQNGGLISSWKAGSKLSTGQYLTYVDSDDWIEKNMLEEMAGELTGNRHEIISSDYRIEQTDKEPEFIWQQLPPGEYLRADMEQKVIPQILGNEKRYVCMSRCMKLTARDLIINNMRYSKEEIRMGEDTTIMLPSLLDCERLVIMDHKAYYHYRYVEQSMIHGYDTALLENNMRLKEIIDQVILEKTRDQERTRLLNQANKEYLFLLLLVLKNEARGNKKGYYRNIKKICQQKDLKTVIKETTIKVEELSNKLLYYVLKHPDFLSIRLLRLAMIIYYR